MVEHGIMYDLAVVGDEFPLPDCVVSREEDIIDWDSLRVGKVTVAMSCWAHWM